MKEENQNQTAESCKCSKKSCLCHKILGLKGLSMIYKVLSIIVIVIMFIQLGIGWYDIISANLPIKEGLLWSLDIIIRFMFIALFLFTISKVLKVLKKIKYAVSNK
ncbi:MAG: hypothetical protein J6S61_04110 [Elusimicrobiaceae bacterium]|nr:hypothetical protein [Elusimicrobiaceae bacterium]